MNPGRQAQVKASTPSMQVAPLRQGREAQSSTFSRQSTPTKPETQEQEKWEKVEAQSEGVERAEVAQVMVEAVIVEEGGGERERERG